MLPLNTEDKLNVMTATSTDLVLFDLSFPALITPTNAFFFSFILCATVSVLFLVVFECSVFLTGSSEDFQF